MKNLRSKVITGGVYLSFVAFGFIVAKFINIPHFEISKSIDISNIFSLIVAAWLAILITTVFEKRNNDNRVEKDLIISHNNAEAKTPAASASAS